jgi:hypothetical protein
VTTPQTIIRERNAGFRLLGKRHKELGYPRVGLPGRIAAERPRTGQERGWDVHQPTALRMEGECGAQRRLFAAPVAPGARGERGADQHAVMNAKTVPQARTAARRFADRWQADYPKAVTCLRDDLDQLLTCWCYKSVAERKRVRTTNAIERRFREVRRRTRPMGVFSDRTSMDRILVAVFNHENQNQGVSAPLVLTQTF